MKKILASLLATAITAIGVCSTLFASAIYIPVKEDTVSQLLAEGYVEVEKPENPESLLNSLFTDYTYAVLQKDDKYARVVISGWNSVFFKGEVQL